mgnify:FL=1
MIATIKPVKGKRGALIVAPQADKADMFSLAPADLKKLVQGFMWMDEHFAGKSLQEIAQREKVSDSHVGKIITARLDGKYAPIWSAWLSK